MSNVMHRHWHACPDCGRPWECYIPGGCRGDKDKPCRGCSDDADDVDDREEDLD